MINARGQEIERAAEELGVKSLVVDSRKIAGLGYIIESLGVAHEKMEILLTGGISDYFNTTDEGGRQWGFNRARVETGLLMDCMEQMEMILEDAGKLLKECEGCREYKQGRCATMPPDEEIRRIYNEAEDWPDAGVEIKGPYRKLHGDFNGYIDAVEERAFFHGFRCAVKRMGKEGSLNGPGCQESVRAPLTDKEIKQANRRLLQAAKAALKQGGQE